MAHVDRSAQYLLRLDDLCPTVHAERWKRLQLLIREFGICPILAVVPENQDRELEVGAADPGFWNQMRWMETTGAAIAIHGLTHGCLSSGVSLLPLHGSSEFAGLPHPVQSERMARALATLRSHKLAPKLFVAPRHSFDQNTLRAMREEGICFLSDGFARRPFKRFGITWIPAQLWSPIPQSCGLWTICIHPNTITDDGFEELRSFVSRYAAQFTSFDRVVAEIVPEPLSAVERTLQVIAIGRLRLRRVKSRWFR